MNTPTAMSRADPGSAGAVKAVSVISTGTVQIRPEHPYGSRKPMYWWLLTSRQWTPPRPVNVYVIEHTRGLILFDTGQDRASVTDDHYFPGGLTGYLYGRLAPGWLLLTNDGGAHWDRIRPSDPARAATHPAAARSHFANHRIAPPLAAVHTEDASHGHWPMAKWLRSAGKRGARRCTTHRHSD